MEISRVFIRNKRKLNFGSLWVFEFFLVSSNMNNHHIRFWWFCSLSKIVLCTYQFVVQVQWFQSEWLTTTSLFLRLMHIWNFLFEEKVIALRKCYKCKYKKDKTWLFRPYHWKYRCIELDGCENWSSGTSWNHRANLIMWMLKYEINSLQKKET